MGKLTERIASAILYAAMFVLLLPIAAMYQLYDWLHDRKFERETEAKYGAES